MSKVYEDTNTKALRNFNLNIETGEFVFIVGASGAGKSTLLKLMMREEIPTTGEININGFDLNNMKNRKIPHFRRTLGIVFQDFRLIPNMNVYDNIAYAMRVIGSRENAIRKRVPYLLGLVGLNSKARSKPNQLSGGEQQRVAIARALVKNPKLLLCDEPTGALDYATGKMILAQLKKTCKEENMTIVLITHNAALTPIADRVIAMKSGRVISNVINNSPLDVESIEW